MKRLSLLVAVISILLLPVFLSTAQQTNTLPGGAKYVGEMKDGKPDGTGTLIKTNGEMYVGEFKNGLPNGNVTHTWPDGGEYIGQVMSGLPHGHGTYKTPAGTNAQGEWRHGKPYTVSGMKILPDGTREVGVWNYAGTRSGGTITWKDGRRYEGDWKVVVGKSDLPDGHGKMTYPDGKVEEGLWEDGKFMGSSKTP
jgi:hypothetical protein